MLILDSIPLVTPFIFILGLLSLANANTDKLAPLVGPWSAVTIALTLAHLIMQTGTFTVTRPWAITDLNNIVISIVAIVMFAYIKLADTQDSKPGNAVPVPKPPKSPKANTTGKSREHFVECSETLNTVKGPELIDLMVVAEDNGEALAFFRGKKVRFSCEPGVSPGLPARVPLSVIQAQL